MTVEREDASPVRLRVHELADHLGVTSGDVIRRAQQLGIDAHSPLQSLSEADVGTLVEEFRSAEDVPSDHELVIELPTDGRVDEGSAARSGLMETLEARWGIGPMTRRLVVTAMSIVLGTVMLAVGYSFLRPAYAAEAQVFVGSTGTDSSLIERELRSFEVIANSPTVLAPVAEQFGLSLTDVREMLTTEIQNDSRIIRFEVTDPDPSTAESVAAAVVSSFVAEAGRASSGAFATYLEDRIADLEEAIDGLDADLAEQQSTLSSIEAERGRLESEIELATSKLVELESRLADIRSSADAPSGAATFLSGQIEETRATLDAQLAELDALITSRVTPTELEIARLEEERARLIDELDDLRGNQLELEVDDIARPRVQVLSDARLSEEPAGLTPVKATALGVVVGGILASLWIVAATQLRREP